MVVIEIHIGHLGIFVSAGVAKKEHDEFASNIDMIDVLPPGLYEAVLTPKGDLAAHADMASGEWAMRCEARTLDDIRALGGNDAADDRRFAAAAKVSEINLALYRTFAQPLVRQMVTPPVAEALRKMNPTRLQMEMFGAANPFMAWVKAAAEKARETRKPAAAENPLLQVQEQVSRQIVEGLEAFRKASEHFSEEAFRAIYGAPALQSALGIDPHAARPPRKAAKSLLHQALMETRIAELKAAMGAGGLRAALIRALVHVGMARGGADERSFEAIRRIRRAHAGPDALPLPAFKHLVREQYFMLTIDRDAALAAIPAMLPEAAEERRAALTLLRGVLEASGSVEGEAAERLAEVARLFGVEGDAQKALTDDRALESALKTVRRAVAKTEDR